MPPKRHKIWDLCFDSGPKMPGKSYYPVACKYCQSAWKHGKLEDAIKHIALVCENAPPAHRKMALEEHNASHSRAKNTKQIIATSGQISLDHQGELLPDDSVSQTSTSRRKRKPVIMVQEEKEEQPAEVKANNPATVAKKSDKNKQDPSSSSGLDQLYAAINVNNAPAYSIPRVDSASTGNRQVSSSIPTVPSLTNGMITATGGSNKTPTVGNDVHSPVSLDGQGFKPPAQYVADSDLYLAAWLLKTNIPLDCLECAEFRQFINSCSGGMYQLPTQHELQQIALVLLRQQQQQQQQQFQHGQLQVMHTNQQNNRHFPCPTQQQQEIQRQEQMLQSNNPKRW